MLPNLINKTADCIDLGHGATADFLYGDRLHLQQGPINVLLRAYGSPASVAEAYEKTVAEFRCLLKNLVENLPVLRQSIDPQCSSERLLLQDKTARRMMNVALPYAGEFLTPMVAVAGAVADQLISCISSVSGIDKCFVNNGGDIAVYLTDKQSLNIGVVPSLVDAVPNAKILLTKSAGIGGVATSGWDGNSYSLGIADAVTVLASNAAQADVAATMIANQVNVDHVGIGRRAACELDAATDLGEQMVTISVADLPKHYRQSALTRGVNYANKLLDRGLIISALLSLQGDCRLVGDVASASLAKSSNFSLC